MSRELYIVSDLHLGTGRGEPDAPNPLEDFFADDDFGRFLGDITQGFRKLVELVVLGDAFDFPQALPELGKTSPDPHLGTTEEESVRRFDAIAAGHETFFEGLREFLKAGNVLRFVRGNHDVDIAWGGVRVRLSTMLLPAAGKLIFEKTHVFRDGRLYCEHGNQHSPDNVLSYPDSPIRRGPDGTARIERCWGTYFMDDYYNDVERRFPAIDNVPSKVLGVQLAARAGGTWFTAKKLARLLWFIAKSDAPLVRYTKAGVMGESDDSLAVVGPAPRIHTADDLLDHLIDRELADIIRRRCTDETGFRQEFEAQIQETLDDLGELAPDTTADTGLTMGTVRGMDPYSRAADEILRENQDVQVVVMGHTHTPKRTVGTGKDLPQGKTYVNSGSWTRSYDMSDPRNADLSLDELETRGILKNSLDFVKVTITEDGSIGAELWSAGSI